MIPNKKEELPHNGTSNTRKLLDSSFQGVKKDYLFLLLIILMQIVELKSILIESIFFQE